MTKQEKQLLLIDLCARLQYGVDLQINKKVTERLYSIVKNRNTEVWFVNGVNVDLIEIKPYLRPMSSMTEEEAKEIAILHGIKDILSVKVTSDYIDVIVDDGVCSTERRTIWYDEIISSIKIFDWLNAHHFDFHGLIKMGLGIDCTGLNIYENEKSI